MVAKGVTVVVAPVAPFDHTTEPEQPAAVNTTLCPAQTVGAPALMVGEVVGFTVTVTGADVALVQAPTLQIAV